MKKSLPIVATMILAGVQSAHAHGDEHQMDGAMHNPCSMHAQMGEMKKGTMRGFMRKKSIDGYDVTFHVMKAPAAMRQAGSYHLMVKMEQHGKAVTNLIANSKVIHPNGKSESKMLMKMGTWYMAAYNLDHPGTHQIMVLFKSDDGAKHFGGIKFSVDDTK